MREWFVIEDSRKNSVFAPDGADVPHGYFPREAAEQICGRKLDGTVWFTKEQGDAMRAHPEWRDTEPN